MSYEQGFELGCTYAREKFKKDICNAEYNRGFANGCAETINAIKKFCANSLANLLQARESGMISKETFDFAFGQLSEFIKILEDAPSDEHIRD